MNCKSFYHINAQKIEEKEIVRQELMQVLLREDG